MRRLTLLISVLAILAVAIPATASVKRHHRGHHHARVADRNHNGMPDRWEHRFRVHSATGDPDHDGVTNIGELHNGTNPRDADSNNNGIEDGQDDANDDGVQDGQEQSGTIVSFDSGVLTVSLVNGDKLKGAVNSRTELECDDSTQTTTTASTRHDGGDSSSGDQSESGDDNDDEGDDASCGTGALTAGTIVKEAELRLTSTGAVFEKIELGGKAPA